MYIDQVRREFIEAIQNGDRKTGKRFRTILLNLKSQMYRSDGENPREAKENARKYIRKISEQAKNTSRGIPTQ